MTDATMQNRHFVLASRSPRRSALLARIGVVPNVTVGADIDEKPIKGELPSAAARRLALEKLTRVKDSYPGSFILAADTVVAVGRRILGKADEASMARLHLELLSGRRHRVVTAVALRSPHGRSSLRAVTTTVCFRLLQSDEIAAYLKTDEWQGKAGSYAIQGAAEVFVRQINGSYSNVVGLPLCETVAMLRGLGWPVLGQ